MPIITIWSIFVLWVILYIYCSGPVVYFGLCVRGIYYKPKSKPIVQYFNISHLATLLELRKSDFMRFSILECITWKLYCNASASCSLMITDRQSSNIAWNNKRKLTASVWGHFCSKYHWLTSLTKLEVNMSASAWLLWSPLYQTYKPLSMFFLFSFHAENTAVHIPPSHVCLLQWSWKHSD